MKVLVIDDDPAILELVSQYLTLSAQHEVRAEQSARDALAAIEEVDGLFECFLIDIQMPGVDGITLVEFIRERPEYRATPIIMLTAMEDKEHVDRAFAAGATDYVTKPFDFYDLQIRMHAASETARAKVSAARVAAASADAARAGARPRLRLADPISLPDVECAIDSAEFENYVRQLLKRRLYRVSAIAVKIGGVEEIHAALAEEDFRRVIRDVAEKIRARLLAVGGILTYRGNGIFLCIPGQRLQGRRNAIQKALNKNHRIVHPSVGRIPSTLYVGDQIPLGNGTDKGVLAALNLAIESVETQGAGFGELFDASTRFLKGEGLGEEPGAWQPATNKPVA